MAESPSTGIIDTSGNLTELLAGSGRLRPVSTQQRQQAPRPTERDPIDRLSDRWNSRIENQFRAIDGEYTPGPYSIEPTRFRQFRAIQNPERYVFAQPQSVFTADGRPNPQVAPFAFRDPLASPPVENDNPRFRAAEAATSRASLSALCASATAIPEDQAKIFTSVADAIVRIHHNDPNLAVRLLQTQSPESLRLLIQNDFNPDGTPRPREQQLFVYEQGMRNINFDAFRQQHTRRLGELQPALRKGMLTEPQRQYIDELLARSFDVGRMIKDLRVPPPFTPVYYYDTQTGAPMLATDYQIQDLNQRVEPNLRSWTTLGIPISTLPFIEAINREIFTQRRHPLQQEDTDPLFNFIRQQQQQGQPISRVLDIGFGNFFAHLQGKYGIDINRIIANVNADREQQRQQQEQQRQQQQEQQRTNTESPALTDEQMAFALRYLAYQDSPDIPFDQNARESYFNTSAMARHYVRELQAMFDDYGEAVVVGRAQEQRDRLVQQLTNLGIDSSGNPDSVTWYLWDAAKQRFLGNPNNDQIRQNLRHPDLYRPYDPFGSDINRAQQAQEDIYHTMLGWAVANRDRSSLTLPADQIDTLEERIDTLTQQSDQPNNRLSSFQLREIGEFIDQLSASQPAPTIEPAPPSGPTGPAVVESAPVVEPVPTEPAARVLRVDNPAGDVVAQELGERRQLQFRLGPMVRSVAIGAAIGVRGGPVGAGVGATLGAVKGLAWEGIKQVLSDRKRDKELLTWVADVTPITAQRAAEIYQWMAAPQNATDIDAPLRDDQAFKNASVYVESIRDLRTILENETQNRLPEATQQAITDELDDLEQNPDSAQYNDQVGFLATFFKRADGTNDILLQIRPKQEPQPSTAGATTSEAGGTPGSAGVVPDSSVLND